MRRLVFVNRLIRNKLLTTERKVLRTQLLCTFIKKTELKAITEAISHKFIVPNDKIFVLTSVDLPSEIIVSYNIQMNERKVFLPNSIMVHRKRETNTIYTINALNELIRALNNGVLDRSFQIDWERFRDILLLKRPDGFHKLRLKTAEVIQLPSR